MLRGNNMAGVVLLLSRHGTIVRIRVLDTAGNPVEGAALRLRASPAEAEFTAEQRASVIFARSTNRIAASAPDGSWAFAGVPAGRVVVTAEKGGRRAKAEIAAAGIDAELTLALR